MGGVGFINPNIKRSSEKVSDDLMAWGRESYSSFPSPLE
ncbi:hypothetical protein MCC93_18270 [Morococcus cerebrosus]|uniref:Uncharacterized protein n=1 Tax=Morococcus cerebrosus TaxID=1056807 RepID=A0A0C1EDB0_9NEIS|nr:hypothetical protein MCC93_18270 [Morococcus cerebrosus]